MGKSWIEKDELAGSILLKFMVEQPENSPLRDISSKLLRKLIIAGIEQSHHLQPEVDSGVFRFLDSIDLNTLPQEARHAIREAKHLIINSHHPQISEERIEEVLLDFMEWVIKEEKINSSQPELYVKDFLELTKPEK